MHSKNRADETQEVENNCFILEIRVLDSKCHEEHCETQPDSKKKSFPGTFTNCGRTEADVINAIYN